MSPHSISPIVAAVGLSGTLHAALFGLFAWYGPTMTVGAPRREVASSLVLTDDFAAPPAQSPETNPPPEPVAEKVPEPPAPPPEPPPIPPPPVVPPEVTPGVDDGAAEAKAWLQSQGDLPHTGLPSSVEQPALTQVPGMPTPPVPASAGSPGAQALPASAPMEAVVRKPVAPPAPQPPVGMPAPVAPPLASVPPPPPRATAPVADTSAPTPEATGGDEPAPPADPALPSDVKPDVPTKPDAIAAAKPLPPGEVVEGVEDAPERPEPSRPAEVAPPRVEPEVETADAKPSEAPPVNAKQADPRQADPRKADAKPLETEPSEVPRRDEDAPEFNPASKPVKEIVPTEATEPRDDAVPVPAEPTPDAATPQDAVEALAPSTAATPAQPSSGGSSPGDRPFERADRDADPTSVEGVGQIRFGRVVARDGIEIQPTRPRFSHTVRLTTIPRNPTVRITFSRAGRVTKAEFLPGRSTGYPEVDGPLLSAMYRWTAKGKKLRDVGPAGITMNFRVILREERELGEPAEETSEPESPAAKPSEPPEEERP